MKRKYGSKSLNNNNEGANEDANDAIHAKKSKKIQAVLSFPSVSSERTSKMSTCEACGMSYHSFIIKDKELHDKYHKKFVEGVIWPAGLARKELVSFSVQKNVSKGKKSKSCLIDTNLTEKKTFSACIITIDKKSIKQVKKVEEVLQMVNQELNAPKDSRQWQDEMMDSSKAFLIIIANRVVGVCSTDKITNVDQQCRWMIYSSQMVVPNQINRQIKVGISRIWIAPTWRGLKLSLKLLDTVLKHSIYGIILTKNQIGFSQPSRSGNLLAKSFNSTKHKSGEILIPIYLED